MEWKRNFFSPPRFSVPAELNPDVLGASLASSSPLKLEQMVLEEGKERDAVWTPNFSIAHLIEFTRLETLK